MVNRSGPSSEAHPNTDDAYVITMQTTNGSNELNGITGTMCVDVLTIPKTNFTTFKTHRIPALTVYIQYGGIH